MMRLPGVNELAFLERKLSPNQRTKIGLLRNLGQVCFIIIELSYFASLDMMRLPGFEPGTPALSEQCATGLRYSLIKNSRKIHL